MIDGTVTNDYRIAGDGIDQEITPEGSKVPRAAEQTLAIFACTES